MLTFTHRSTTKELLDGGDIPFNDIKQNLIELNTVNTLLGGHKITLAGLQQFLNGFKEPIHIVEIGSGGGDNLHIIEKFLLKRKINFKLTGIDIKKECIDYASRKYPSVQFICSDYKDVTFTKKPDIIFNSLFCHHFTNEELAEILLWMNEHSTHGFFVNDLQRHWLAYYSIKLLTATFSSSYLVKNDAPLSVARSFTKQDWKEILNATGIKNYTLAWKWAFRYLLSVRK